MPYDLITPRAVRYPCSKIVSPAERFWKKVDRATNPEGCWPWTAGCNSQGYGNFSLDGQTVAAHRIAYELQNGPIPDGLEVMHICDNPPCCRGSHLTLGTRLDNHRDMQAKARSPKGAKNGKHKHPESAARGERQGSAKLRDVDIVDIRRARMQGETLVSIAKRYGVVHTAIGRILRGEGWRHVK